MGQVFGLANKCSTKMFPQNSTTTVGRKEILHDAEASHISPDKILQQLEMTNNKEEFEQQVKSHFDFILTNIDKIAKPNLSVNKCELLLHCMFHCDRSTELSKQALSALLSNNLHRNVYEAVEKFMLFSEKARFFTAVKLINLLPRHSKEDCSLMLKLIYLSFTKLTKRYCDNECIKVLTEHCGLITSVIKSFPKLVEIEYCELLLYLILCYGLPTGELQNAISTITDYDFHLVLLKAFIKTIKHQKYTDAFIVIFCICCKTLLRYRKKNEGKQLVVSNTQFILSIGHKITNLPCCTRQQYSVVLLHLLYHFNLTGNAKETDAVLTALRDFKVSLWRQSFRNHSCYCFGGIRECVKCAEYDNQHHRYSLRGLKLKDSLPGLELEVDKLFRNRQIEILCNIFPTVYSMHTGDGIDWILEGIHNENISNETFQQMKLNQLAFMDYVSNGRIPFDHYIVSLTELVSKPGDIEIATQQLIDILERIYQKLKEDEIVKIIKTLCQLETPTKIDDFLIQGLVAFFEFENSRQNLKISKLILDINMKVEACEFLRKLTLQMGQLLDLVGNDVKEVIYKCYCIFRQENKNNNGTETNNNIDIYKEYFKFIYQLEKEEEMEKLSRHHEMVHMLMLLLKASSGGHHTSAELKKYLSLKYEYDDAVLYLLWCSGDVEINPGPTLKEIKKVPPSVKERNWIYDVCSTMLKLLKGIPTYSNPNRNLWDGKEKPDTWPENKPFYDPRNPKGYPRNPDSDKQLLHNLQKCCEKETIDIPLDLLKEVSAWKNNDKILLYQLFILRQELGEIGHATQNLIQYKDTTELMNSLKTVKISFDSGILSSNRNGNKTSKSDTEVVRDLKVTLGRLSKGQDPLLKSDGLWNEPPKGWKQENLQLYRNAVKRTGKDQDIKMVNALIEYCEENDKAIPTECQPMVDAWKSGDMNVVKEYHTIWSNVTIIAHSLKYLQVEGLLGKHDIHDQLKQHGLILDLEYWKINAEDLNTNRQKSQSASQSSQCLQIQQNIRSSTSQPGSISATCAIPSALKQTPSQEKSLTLSESTILKLTDAKTKGKKRKLDNTKPMCIDSKKQTFSDSDQQSESLFSTPKYNKVFNVTDNQLVISREQIQLQHLILTQENEVQPTTAISIDPNTTALSRTKHQSDRTVNHQDYQNIDNGLQTCTPQSHSTIKHQDYLNINTNEWLQTCAPQSNSTANHLDYLNPKTDNGQQTCTSQSHSTINHHHYLNINTDDVQQTCTPQSHSIVNHNDYLNPNTDDGLQTCTPQSHSTVNHHDYLNPNTDDGQQTCTPQSHSTIYHQDYLNINTDDWLQTCTPQSNSTANNLDYLIPVTDNGQQTCAPQSYRTINPGDCLNSNTGDGQQSCTAQSDSTFNPDDFLNPITKDTPQTSIENTTGNNQACLSHMERRKSHASMEREGQEKNYLVDLMNFDPDKIIEDMDL